jgi:methylmalonyl-CoA/ethylmalonyl-CoA epimerase
MRREMKNTTVKTPLSIKFTHVGVVIREMDKTVKRLESLGIGPFEQFTSNSLPPLAEKLLFRGKPYEGETKVFIADFGKWRLELFEPLGGQSPWQEYLDRNGEGIHHIGFTTDNFDADLARFTEQEGVVVIHRARQLNGGGSAYLDLGTGGLVLELEKYWTE